jgi:protein-tyrosine phosphatase
VARDDFYRFHHIVALDARNFADLRAMQPPDGIARLSLLLDHAEGRAGQAVPDPYYGDDDIFDFTWSVVTEGAAGLARIIAKEE